MPDLGDEAEADSLSLLPTVIQHLPELLSKPSLACGVFQAVRNASRSQRSLPFISPLIAPLTAVALNAATAELRGDAVYTCVALVRALVTRRLVRVATAYVLDLTAAARLIIEHDAPTPLSSFLKEFMSTARGLAISEKEVSSLDAVKIPPVPISPSSLEALVFLLAALIPSQIPLPFPEPSLVLGSQTDDPSQSKSRIHSSLPHSASIRLWVKVGASARSSVLNLVSSHVLLSGRCGSAVAIASAVVLERAFDPSSGCVVPATICGRLLAVVHVVLEDSHLVSASSKEADKIRLRLYKVARLASSSGQIPSSMWSSAGIHTAVCDDGDVGNMLRSFSRCGLVSRHSSDREDVYRNEQSSNAERRPRKRRRVADVPQLTDTDDQPGSLQQALSHSQSTVLLIDGGKPSDSVATLIRELGKLESIYCCVEDPKAVEILRRVTALTSDSLIHICHDKAAIHHAALQSWLAFARSISQIIKDVSGNIRVESDGDLWEGLLQLASECLRLVSSVHSVEALFSGARPIHKATPATRAQSDIDPLLNSVVSIVNCASVTLERAPMKLNAKVLSALTWDLAEMTRGGFVPSDKERLSDACERLQAFSLKGHPDDEPPQRAELLKGSFHMSSLLNHRSPGVGIRESVAKLCTMISENTSMFPDLAASALYAVSDVVCMSVNCRTAHFVPRQQTENKPLAVSSTDDETWTTVFEVVRSVVRGTGADELIAAATHSLGTLVVHAPTSKAGEATSVLIQTLWHPTSHSARSKTIKCLFSLLAIHLSLRHKILLEHQLSTSNPISLCRQEDSWDGFEKVLFMRGEVNDVFRLLGVELQKRIKNWNGIIRQGQIHELQNLDVGPLVMILILQSDEFVVSRIKGLAADSLLAIAVAELQSWFPSPSREKDSHVRGLEPRRLLKTWNHLISQAYDLNEEIRLDRDTCKTSLQVPVLCLSKRARVDIVKGRQPVGLIVSSFLSSRIREWLPFALPRMLVSDSFASQLGEILMFRDVIAFWKKVPKHTVGPLLRSGDALGLESLALRVNESKKELVERVCSDALARAAMTQAEGLDLDPAGANALICESLQTPLPTIIAKRAGKIVQRVVMEIGGHRDQQARSALVSLARILHVEPLSGLSDSDASGMLISAHFMLVMDAVNRGLFNSRASVKERLQFLCMLDGVLGLARDRLHVFVPKVLATLKMALETERENISFRQQTMKVWTNFLLNLGGQRMLPHLSSILAILLPFVSGRESTLCQTLQQLIRDGKTQSFTNWSEVILLLHIADHPSLSETANELERDLNSWNPTKGDNLTRRVPNDQTETLLTTCETVGKIIAKHENGVIEVMAINYLWVQLQKNRKCVDKMLHFLSVRESRENRAVDAIARLLANLVSNLNRSTNKECQEKIMRCIGEIGALDPSLVSRINHPPAETESGEIPLKEKHTYSSCTVHSLVAYLLDKFLVPALVRGEKRNGSSNLLNRVGLVIQELLRVCGCRADTASRASKTIRSRSPSDPPLSWRNGLDGTEEEKGIFFWENLAGTTRTVVQPYLAEPFDVQLYSGVFGGNSAGDVSLACQPVWSKVKAASVIGVVVSAQEWQRQTVVQLVDYIGNQGKLGKTLKALRPVLRYDDKVAAFIFPFAVTAALDLQRAKGSVELQQFLVTEVASVLRECTSPRPVFHLLDTLRAWREERCKSRGRLISARSVPPGSNVGVPKRRIPMDVNIAKERLSDTLSSLVDMDGHESPKLSLLIQARAAYGARSYARAVLLAECYIRNMRTNRGNRHWPAHIDSLRGKGEIVDGSRGLGESEALSILQKSFAELEDADSMAGIAFLRSKSSLADTVIDAEAAGRYDEALVTYERALGTQPRHSQLHAGFLRCLMTLGHWETMLSHAEGLVSSAKLSEMELRQAAQALGIDAAWRLGRWEKLDDFGTYSIDCDGEADVRSNKPWILEFNVCFGKMLASLKQRSMESLQNAATEARRHLLGPTTRLAREGYSRAYPMLVLIHSLADIEDAAMMSLGVVKATTQSSPDIDLAFQDSAHSTALIALSGRFNSTAASLKTREPLLSAKRVCYELLSMRCEAASTNLELAKLAHEGGNLRAASAYAFSASSKAPLDSEVKHEAVLQMARICHDQGDASGALLMVQKEIQSLLAARNNQSESESVAISRAISGRLCTAYTMAGRWIENARSEPSDVILSFFEQAALLDPSREEPFYALGRHYDMLLQAGASVDANIGLAPDSNSARSSRRSLGGAANGNGPLQGSEYVPLIIKSFAQALRNGHCRIYEALPRMMTVWLDYHSAANCPDARLAGGPVEGEVKREIKKALDSIPVYMWMTAIPQLMSRLLHPRKIVRDELTQLLARIFCAYPDQCIWLILPSSQLKTADRKKAAMDVLGGAVQMTRKGKSVAFRESRQERAKNLKLRIQSSISIMRYFIDICLTMLPKDRRGRMENCSNEFRPLLNHLASSENSHPIIPTLETLTVQLPTASGAEHRAFAAEPARIAAIESNALVMSSLMRPRRISLVGSDGRQYRFLAKKETAGDMRKDSRLVEFVTVVNRLLSKDPVSRRKELELKTYAVLPLTEETGMIEWVNDLDPLRKLVREKHLAIPDLPDTSTIQSKYQNTKDSKKFLEWAIAKFPPVLDKFFLQKFGRGSEPRSWLRARNMWTKSVAVWSMAGYVVGLGDRHGENVLIETTTGRCVHVDFAMLFDKGMKLKVPEIVPFRLTPNMISAMGISGYEGTFRVVSEAVMGILRRNADALLGVLETFLHDPLADWGRSDTRGANGTIVASKEAWQTRAAVKAKLTGMVDNSGLPLSIQGQVQRLIHEATSMDNLSKMYVWWSGWL